MTGQEITDEKKNRYFIVFLLIIFSFTGLTFIKSDTFTVTPFYLVSIILFFYVFLHWNGKISFKQLGLIVLMLGVLISSLFQFQIHISSLLHFLYWGMIFVAFYQLFRQITKNMMIKACQWIIWLFFINVLISFILYKLHFHNEVLNIFFPTLLDEEGNVRLQAFASEPSYTVIIITVAILALNYLGFLLERKTQLLYFFIYLITILLVKSSYGFICLGIVCWLLYGKYVKISLKYWFFLVLIGVVLLYFASENRYILRIQTLLELIWEHGLSLNFLDSLKLVDSSAYYRFGPSYIYLSTLDFFNWKTWLGFGLGNDTTFFAHMFSSSTGQYERLGLGFFPAFFYVAGIVFAIFMLILLFRYFLNGLPFLMKLLVFTILFNCNFSTQLFWFVIVFFSWLAYYNKYLRFTPEAISQYGTDFMD